MGAVRMPQLTPSALALIAPRLQWISQEQCTLALFAKQRKLSRALHADLRVPAVWLLGERQQSPKASHTMEFACDLSAIQSCCSRALAAAVGRNRNLHVACSSSFGGRDWQFQWQATRVEAGVDLSVFLGPCFANLPSTKFSSNIAWLPVGAKFRVGAVLERCLTAAEYTTRKSGFRLCVLRSAEAWQSPAWAEGERVIARVTVGVDNCV